MIGSACPYCNSTSCLIHNGFLSIWTSFARDNPSIKLSTSNTQILYQDIEYIFFYYKDIRILTIHKDLSHTSYFSTIMQNLQYVTESLIYRIHDNSGLELSKHNILEY